MMNIFRVILPVHDIEQASIFYSGILQDEGERVSKGRHYFQCGATILACYDPVADGDEPGQGWQVHENQYIYFAVSELEHVYKTVLQHGGEIISEIESMPWGETLFYATDPFGNRLSFVDQSTLFTGERGKH